MAVLETPSLRKRRVSSSLPSSRETPSEPFGRPSFRPEALALARPSRVRDGLVLDHVDGKVRFAAPYSSVLYVVTKATGQPGVSHAQ